MANPQFPCNGLSAVHEARPLMWWTETQLQMLGSRVMGVWSAWIRDWANGATPCEAQAVLAHDQHAFEKGSWIPLGRRGAAAAWIQVQADVATDVFQTLFAASPAARPASEDGIAQAVAAHAWDALGEGLRTCFALDSNSEHAGPDALSFRPWSGCVLAVLAGPGHPLRAVLLNGACAQAVLEAPIASPAAEGGRPKSGSALVPCAVALAERRLPLHVELSPCELDIGTLESLRIGDIVPIAHALEAPLLVTTSGDIRICSGFLGRQGGDKAIELAREMSPDGKAPIDQP